MANTTKQEAGNRETSKRQTGQRAQRQNGEAANGRNGPDHPGEVTMALAFAASAAAPGCPAGPSVRPCASAESPGPRGLQRYLGECLAWVRSTGSGFLRKSPETRERTLDHESLQESYFVLTYISKIFGNLTRTPRNLQENLI